jgi:hypothetical protein
MIKRNKIKTVNKKNRAKRFKIATTTNVKLLSKTVITILAKRRTNSTMGMVSISLKPMAHSKVTGRTAKPMGWAQVSTYMETSTQASIKMGIAMVEAWMSMSMEKNMRATLRITANLGLASICMRMVITMKVNGS